MNPDDDAIRDAVRGEEKRMERVLEDDLQMTELIISSFRGRQRWQTIFPIVLSLIYTALLVWCAVEFFRSDTVKHQIAWATGFLGFAMSVGLTKVWVWINWQRYALAREVKRLELAVMELSKRVGG